MRFPTKAALGAAFADNPHMDENQAISFPGWKAVLAEREGIHSVPSHAKRGTGRPASVTVSVNIAAGRAQRPCSP